MQNTQRPLSVKECAWLLLMKSAVDKHWNALTQWEKQFMKGILSRVERFGANTIVSKDQWARITEISEKIM